MTKGVVSPTCDGAVVEYCAGVFVAGGDSGCDASGAEVDGCAWCVCVGVVAVAKLTKGVMSPTLNASVRQKSTSVISPTVDLNRVVRVSGSDRRTKNPLRSWWNLCATNCSY